MDQRVVEHAKILVNHSTKVRRGDQVLIRLGGHQYSGDEGLDLALEVYKECCRLGAHPLIMAFPREAVLGFYELTPEDELLKTPRHYLELTKSSDVVIAIQAQSDTRVLEGVDPDRISKGVLGIDPVSGVQLKKRWCGTLHPTEAHAREADMSLAEYRDFVYSAILRDWKSEGERMNKLKQLMQQTNQVRLIGKDTDLTFSIKGRVAEIDQGENNMPGGEVFTAPVDDSANGRIFFDLPSVKYSREATDVRLTFKNGNITDYSASKNEDLLKRMIETDDGSKRLGEFGVGMNRGIDRFTKTILFDEKMVATIHLAVGFAYEECGGVNKSAVHWDMIKTMKPGEIQFDGKAVQKDGIFAWEM